MRFLAAATAAALSLLPLANAAERYAPTWDSLDKRPVPAWFPDAKFGIFIHWGVYSVPAYAPIGHPHETMYAEWYWNSLHAGRELFEKTGHGNATFDFHVKTYGRDFLYPEFAPRFKAEMFDPAQWAEVFKKSGARYVVLTSKHHDGFALWPSKEATRDWGHPWNSVDAGPHRDLLGDLTDAVRAQGLRMGFYYSLYEWYNPLYLSDKQRYINEHLFPQFKDAVTRYKPSLIFSDGEWDLTSAEWRSPELLAWLYNDSPVKDEVIVDDRWGKDTRHKHGGYYTTEYTPGLENVAHAWEENRGMGHSYGYNRAERLSDYRTGRELVLMLSDLVSRGGNLLLDIGPTADGRIPVVMEERLLEIGKWLDVNGEAIYGTRPWRNNRQWSAGERPKMQVNSEYMKPYEITQLVDGAGPGMARVEAFFTRGKDALYAIVPGWPGAEFEIRDVGAANGVHATILGDSRAVRVVSSARGITLRVPPRPGGDAACSYATVIKLTGVR